MVTFTDTDPSEFERQRPRLFGLAYRLLGSAQEAEDVVQDAFIRWHGVDRDTIVVPSAWLAKVVTNLCLNRLTAARAQREHYVGPWLPEPVLTEDETVGPLATVEQRESVSLAMLVLLERLTPAERAVFVLREAFVYSHREIAEIMDLSEANCRQLHHRARRHVEAARSRFAPDPRQQRALVERFLAAVREGDLDGLAEMLAADVVSWADGGGQVGAARRPVLGRDKVCRYLIGGIGKVSPGLQVLLVEINGEPALLGLVSGVPIGVVVPEVTDRTISALRIMVNPEKLRFLARQVVTLSHPGRPAGSEG